MKALQTHELRDPTRPSSRAFIFPLADGVRAVLSFSSMTTSQLAPSRATNEVIIATLARLKKAHDTKTLLDREIVDPTRINSRGFIFPLTKKQEAIFTTAILPNHSHIHRPPTDHELLAAIVATSQTHINTFIKS